MGDYRPAGSKVWSPEEWEAYSRLETQEAEADDEAAEAATLLGKLQDRMGVQLGPEKKWDHTTWPTDEKSEYKRLLGEFGKFSKIAREASNRRSALVAKLKQKYPAASLARKQAIAVEATKSDVFEKLKYAPPRMGLPGGPGYELAKASFGKGRTRRHKRRRSRKTRRGGMYGY